jgi:hypothetical protein
MISPNSLHYKEALRGADLAAELGEDAAAKLHARLEARLTEIARELRGSDAATLSVFLLKFGVAEKDIRRDCSDG